jgi:hypothetical protein
LLSRSGANNEVILVTEDKGYEITSTDENGAFVFQDFEYPDSSAFTIRALSRKGSDNVKLVLDKESFPVPVYAPQSPVLTIPVETEDDLSLHTDNFIVKAEQRSKYDEDMRMIYLGEIEVTARRFNLKEERRLDFWANSSSDFTIRREQLDKLYYPNLAQYLSLVPGVRVFPSTEEMGSFIISVCALCGPPLILVDGAQVENLDDISTDVVESIDVLKYVSTTEFGVRGGNGVISITTKTGGDIEKVIEKSNITVYTPLGYQSPLEFYSPKYETLSEKQSPVSDYRTTIFWKPDVVILDDREETFFEFYTSDFPTTYSVVIEGLTTDGKIVRQVEKIRVE